MSYKYYVSRNDDRVLKIAISFVVVYFSLAKRSVSLSLLNLFVVQFGLEKLYSVYHQR